MNRVLSQWTDCTVCATDGEVGTVRQFYFDDLTWKIRYLVVRTGGWLSGREVLLSPAAVGQPDWKKRVLPVNLSKEQVRHSPDTDADQPVSRQHEIDLIRHYGWQTYWDGGFYVTPGYRMDAALDEAAAEAAAPSSVVRKADPHLRSTREVSGYRIHASDGDIGHAADFVVDDEEWRIRYLVVDTRQWLPGRRVLVSPQWIRRVRWADGRVFVDLSRDDIRHSPTFDPSKPVSAAYEAKLLAHLQKAEAAVWVAFKFHATPGAEVCLAGTFNGWSRTAIRLGEAGRGTYTTTVLLPVGSYEYKFLVNGHWQDGPCSSEQVPNAFGTTNHVLAVGPPPRRRDHLHTFPRRAQSQEHLLVAAPLTD